VKLARRIGIALAGGTVLLVGVVMIVLPGPAIVVIPIGLAILALEFSWAQRWLDRMRSLLPRKKDQPKPPADR
jgi:tellurite resistance protein TerC